MQKVHKMLILSLFSATTLLNAGCNRYIEEPIDPCADQAAQRAMQARAFSARPGFAPAPQFMRFNGTAPTGDCGGTEPPVVEPPVVEPPIVNPPVEPPVVNPPVVEPPVVNPPVGPTPPAPPVPTPPPPTPSPQPTAPAPTPTPTPPPTKAELFFKAAAGANISFKNEKDLAGRIRAAVDLYPVGFATGKFKTPEENIAHLFNATARSLPRPIPESAEQYAGDALELGKRTSGGSYGVEYYLDLKESAGYNQPLYVLRFDTKTESVVGVAKDPATIWAGPKEAYSAMTARTAGADDGYVFYYGGDYGKRWISSDKRFLPIPHEVIRGTFEAARFQQMNAMQVPAPYGFPPRY